MKTRFHWTDQAKAELGQIGREQAIEILRSLSHYAKTGEGDVKLLHGSRDWRLRVGDYRLRFELLDEDVLRILHVKHRREAYR